MKPGLVPQADAAVPERGLPSSLVHVKDTWQQQTERKCSTWCAHNLSGLLLPVIPPAYQASGSTSCTNLRRLLASAVKRFIGLGQRWALRHSILHVKVRLQYVFRALLINMMQRNNVQSGLHVPFVLNPRPMRCCRYAYIAALSASTYSHVGISNGVTIFTHSRWFRIL